MLSKSLRFLPLSNKFACFILLNAISYSFTVSSVPLSPISWLRPQIKLPVMLWLI